MSETTSPIRILHHLGRSGGTIISRCLAVMDGTILLSEIHPNGHRWFNPLQQANEWFRLFEPAELEKFLGQIFSFEDAIAMVEMRARARGQRLVIRDWTHLDFMAVPFLERCSYRLLTAEALKDRFRLIRAATVRHPLDQWLSWREAVAQADLPLARFLEGCRRFAEQAAALGFVRFEDFLADPDAALRRLCALLDLPFDPRYRGRWQAYDKITGDVPSRTRKAIQAKARPPIDPELAASLAGNPDYKETLRILGYCHDAAAG